MINQSIHEKITLVLSFLILNNYLLLSLGFSQIFIKINFVLFLITILIFYFKNVFSNLYLKFFFIVLIVICLGTPISEWDPRTTWFFHAKRIFFDQTIFSVSDHYAPHSHNDYPTLAPAFAASLATLVGYWNEILPKASFTLMFLPPFIFAYSFFKKTKYVIFLSIVIFTIGKFLFNGWADGLLAVYFGLSAFLMYFLIINNNSYREKKFYYYIAISFFCILTLIKSEGFVLLVILFFVTILIKSYEKKIINNFSNLFFLSFSFLPIILWKIFCYTNNIGDHYIFESNFLSNLMTRLYDFENYKLIFYFLLLNEKFIITLLFFLISFVITKNTILFNYVMFTVIFYILTLFIVYLSTPLDFYFQLDSSAARVIKTLCFFLGVFGLYNLKDYKLISK